MIREAFGAQVKHLRTELGMTQEELSQRSRLAIRFLQDVEAGNKQASIKTVFKLSDGLGVKPDQLLSDTFKGWQKAGKPE
jgi:transcriptional regulator with XRE-family HTH domain